jgi:hypothetical protein
LIGGACWRFVSDRETTLGALFTVLARIDDNGDKVKGLNFLIAKQSASHPTNGQ